MMATHKIEGCLTRFRMRWYDGTSITPEAFKNCDGTRVPVSSVEFQKGPASEDIIGYADLEWRPDGIYYVVFLNDTPKGDKTVDRVFQDHWRPALYANMVKRNNDREVTYGVIRGLFFSLTCDASARVFKVDGKDVPLPTTDQIKVEKQLKEVNLKIIDLENTIKNAKDELRDFKDKKLQLEGLLEEIKLEGLDDENSY